MHFSPPNTPILYIEFGVYREYTLFFLVLLLNIDHGYSLEQHQLEPPRLSTIYVSSKQEKENIAFFQLNKNDFHFYTHEKLQYIA